MHCDADVEPVLVVVNPLPQLVQGAPLEETSLYFATGQEVQVGVVSPSGNSLCVLSCEWLIVLF